MTNCAHFDTKIPYKSTIGKYINECTCAANCSCNQPGGVCSTIPHAARYCVTWGKTGEPCSDFSCTICVIEKRRRANAIAEDVVNHPKHYGGADDPYETIKVIEAWKLGFNLGNAVKYISRAEKKGAPLEDLKKAAWYLAREIANRTPALTISTPSAEFIFATREEWEADMTLRRAGSDLRGVREVGDNWSSSVEDDARELHAEWLRRNTGKRR